MKRILLKLSGDFLQGPNEIWSASRVDPIMNQLQRLQQEGVQIGIVIGGGNIFRGGRNAFSLDRQFADGVGMAATCVNALFLQACLAKKNIPSRVYGDFLTGGIIAPFHTEQVNRELDEGHIIFFSGGSGHAFFSTDTAAALKALEIHAEILLKGTKVDGVYDQDPVIHPEAKKIDHLTYQQALEGHYAVMDACAFTLCYEHKMPIFVFNLNSENSIYGAVHQTVTGTLIKE